MKSRFIARQTNEILHHFNIRHSKISVDIINSQGKKASVRSNRNVNVYHDKNFETLCWWLLGNFNLIFAQPIVNGSFDWWINILCKVFLAWSWRLNVHTHCNLKTFDSSKYSVAPVCSNALLLLHTLHAN